ncbi:8657_t:CDS:2 [Funneliformis caledonium]|uniref:8657_t:CDS:1 n=1 Tax=Funneliformis caledonium TaxID=1117310 RepID=A0A9N9G7G4_9GLOM|nr:8657_t:CDS:2 [Funneliformis caledonium]
MRTNFLITLFLFVIISVYPLYINAQFYHNETKEYEGTLNTPRIWNMKMYDNGTVLLRLIRIKRIPDKPPNIGLCSLEEFSLRIIYPNGTVVENDILLDIPEFNYCSRADRTDPLNPTNLELIEFYLIGKNYILVTYHNATNSDDYDTYEDWGMIIDYNGNILDRIRFGVSFTTVTHMLIINTYITLNVNREKGFIRLNAIKGSPNAEWRQFNVGPDGKITSLTQGTIEFLDYTSLAVNVISTVDEGYAIVYANTTGKVITAETTQPLENSTQALMKPQVQVFAIPIRYNEPQIEPLLLYQSPIPNLIIESLYCSIANVGVGQVCVLTVKNQDNNRFVAKIAFLSSGSVFSFSIINYLIPSGVTYNKVWEVNSLPFGGYLITNKITVKGSKGSLVYGFLLNNDTASFQQWGLEEPHPSNPNVVYSVLPNNTLMIADLEPDNGNSWSFTMYNLPKMLVRENDYSNANIESSSPMIGGTVIPGNDIVINFYDQVELSDGNIEIYRMEFGQSWLRQIIPGEGCFLENDSRTVVVHVYPCTFSVPDMEYYIKMDNNFVKIKAYREPLLGIKEEVWKVYPTERTDHDERFHPTTSYQFRLTDEGTKAYEEYFSAGNRSDFFNSLLKELADAVPISVDRLDSNKNVERDSDVDNHSYLYLINIVIKHVDSEQGVGIVFNDIRTLVKNKTYTPIGQGKFTNYLDDTFDSKVATNLWEQYKYGLLSVFLVGLVIGPSFFLFTQKKDANKDSENDDKEKAKAEKEEKEKKEKEKKAAEKAIETAAADETEKEKDKVQDFNSWLQSNIVLASIFATLSCADIEVMSVLTLEGLPESYRAPFSSDAETRMVFGAFLNIFVEDIPQLIIQVSSLLIK